MKNKICTHCSKEYTTYSNNNRFCSKKCCSTYHYKKRKPIVDLNMEDIEGEVWKSIVGFEGLYEVSDLGRVKSLERPTNQFSCPFIRKQQLNKFGYLTVGLTKNNKPKTFTVHRLVAMAFILNPDNKEQINHKDGNKKNNRLSNLEWCNAQENQSHRYLELGHEASNRLLNKEQVFEILSQKGKSWRKKIAEKFNVSEACIKAVRTGNNYKDWYNEYLNWIKLKH